MSMAFRGLIWVYSLGGTSTRSTLDMPLHYNFFYSNVLLFCCCKMFYQNYVETLPKILVSIKGQLFKESQISFVITQKCIFGNSFYFCVLSYILWCLVCFFYLIHKSDFRIFLLLFWKITMTMCSWKSWRNP